MSYCTCVKYNVTLVFLLLSREIPLLFLDIWSSQLERFTRPTICRDMGRLQFKMFHSALIYMYTKESGPANRILIGRDTYIMWNINLLTISYSKYCLVSITCAFIRYI